MPRRALPHDDALLDREQVRELIHRDPCEVTRDDDVEGFLHDARRWLGGRRYWLRSGVAAFCRALPGEYRQATSRRSAARRDQPPGDGAAATSPDSAEARSA